MNNNHSPATKKEMVPLPIIIFICASAGAFMGLLAYVKDWL